MRQHSLRGGIYQLYFFKVQNLNRVSKAFSPLTWIYKDPLPGVYELGLAKEHSGMEWQPRKFCDTVT